MGPARVPFEVKDPRGYQEFYDQFASHSAKGAANTLRGYQGGPAAGLRIRGGDQDDHAADADHLRRRGRSCIEPSVYLKKHIATSGLAMFPKSGHTVNIEEPALFNQTLGDFLGAGRCRPMGRARHAVDAGGEEVALSARQTADPHPSRRSLPSG